MDNEEVIFQRINVDERLINETLPEGRCHSLDYVPGNSEHQEEGEHSSGGERSLGKGQKLFL